MKREIFVALGLIIILVLLFFVCKNQVVTFQIDFFIFYSQIAVLFLMFFALIFAMQQINEMRKIEEDKTLLAIESLIEEMEYNKKLLDEYIEHSENGANITTRNGKISWEWNKPRQGAYGQYLVLACKRNLALAREITALYDKLESCKVIIESIQHFVAVNIIESKCIDGGPELFRSEIARHNKQLYDISKEAHILIVQLIEKLRKFII